MDARRWKDVPKFRAGDHRKPETRTVLGLAAIAAHLACDALVFVRDLDRALERREEIEAAINQITDVRVAGGVAIRSIDAWCLALRGRTQSEAERQPKEALVSTGCVTTEDRVALVEGAVLTKLPADAASLRAWLASAERALSP